MAAPLDHPPHAGPPDLSAELRSLAERYHEQPATLGAVLDSMGARGSALLIVICALPFATPITIPGLSTPFGLVILILTARYSLGLPPWLPHRLRRVVLPSRFFTRLLSASSKFIGWQERHLKPRLPVLADTPWKRRCHVAVVIAAALLLMIPLPPLPPFTNTLPALVAVVMTFSLLKRDGAGILTSYAIFAFTVAYFAFWGAIVIETFDRYGGELMAFLGWAA